jgi:hypothetical protein
MPWRELLEMICSAASDWSMEKTLQKIKSFFPAFVFSLLF